MIVREDDMNARMDSTRFDGVAAAAVLASGIGVFVTGLLTTMAEISGALKAALDWYSPAGPLSGKTGTGIVVWLIVWAVLHPAWREKKINFGAVYALSLVLVALGWVLTFPLVFEAFSG